MSMNIVLASIGIALTAIFGLIAFKFSKKLRSKIRLTYLQLDCIPLFESIVQDRDNIEILYKKNPIKPNIFLIKGRIMNTGSSVIDKSIIHSPLSVHLPSNHKWLEGKITTYSKNVNVTCHKKNDSQIEFEWTLLKSDEFFEFDALVEANFSKEEIKDEKVNLNRILSKSITFSQRITNLNKIEKLKRPSRQFDLGKLEIIFILIVIGVSIFFPVLNLINPPYRINFLLEAKNREVIEVKLSYAKENIIRIRGVKKSFSEEIKANEISQKYKLSPIFRKDTQLQLFVIIFFPFLFILACFMLFSYFILVRRRKKLNKLLEVG